jgi:hypothetical protein
MRKHLLSYTVDEYTHMAGMTPPGISCPSGASSRKGKSGGKRSEAATAAPVPVSVLEGLQNLGIYDDDGGDDGRFEQALLPPPPPPARRQSRAAPPQPQASAPARVSPDFNVLIRNTS